VLSALVPFYVQHHLHAPDKLDALFAAIQVSALVCVPVVVWLAGRVQKHVAYAVGMAVWAVVLIGLALVPEGAVVPALILGVLAGPGVAVAHVLPWSMLPDVVEVDAIEGGRDRAGDFYGMMTFLEQVATAFALWTLGNALGFARYVQAADVQGESARMAIRVLIGPVPGAVLLAAAVFALVRPPLTRAAHRAIVARGRSASAGEIRPQPNLQEKGAPRARRFPSDPGALGGESPPKPEACSTPSPQCPTPCALPPAPDPNPAGPGRFGPRRISREKARPARAFSRPALGVWGARAPQS